MSEPQRGHLSPAQIMRHVQGEVSGETREHLENCVECSEKVSEWRDTIRDLSFLSDKTRQACPSSEELADYAADVSASPELTESHLEACPRCKEILQFVHEPDDAVLPLLRSSTKTWRRELIQTVISAPRRRFNPYWAAAAVVMVAMGGFLFWRITASRNKTEVLLAKAYSAARPFEYRLPDAGYAGIRQKKGVQSSFDRPITLVESISRIQRDLDGKPNDPALLALKGRAELLEGDYESAIDSLQRARLSMSSSPDLLTDLGAAYALRADSEKKPSGYAAAIDALLLALKSQPRLDRAWFNLALIYEKMSMVDEAIDAWNRFLALKPPAGWAEEARTRLKTDKGIRQRKQAFDRVLRDPAAFLAAVRAGSQFDAEGYQDAFWKNWLPVFLTDSGAHEAAVIEAHAFRSQFDDPSLEAVIGEAGDPRLQPALEQISRSMVANQAGEADAGRAASQSAIDAIRAVLGPRASATATSLRAGDELAYAARKSGSNADCVKVTESVIPMAEARSYRWIAGQAHIEHSCADGNGSIGNVRDELASTQLAAEHAGLKILALRAASFQTGIDRENGNFGPIWESAYAGLPVYWNSGAPPFRAQEFHYNMSYAASSLGVMESAEVFFQATIRFVEQTANRAMASEDHVRFANLLARKGNVLGALKELDRADQTIATLSPGRTRNYFEWDASIERAETLIASHRAADARALLDRLASAGVSDGVDEQIRFQQAYGLACFMSGDTSGAMTAFNRGIVLNQSKLGSFTRHLDRLAYLESASRSYRYLAQLKLQTEKNPQAALKTWLLYKGNSAPVAKVQPAVYRPERLIVTYAVLPRGIAVFSERAGLLNVRMVDRPAGEIEAGARAFLRLCSNSSSSLSKIHQAGHDLFGLLLGPELTTGEVTEVDIRSDSWLGSIPFSALTDDRGEWLGRSRSILVRTGPRNDAPALRSLPVTLKASVVLAPLASSPEGDRLPPLNSAEAEAGDVAGHFRNAQILRGEAVRLPALSSVIATANLFHFTGHGWSNGGDGALLLPGVGGTTATVTAREFARLNWRNCSLAVLSACLTGTGENRFAGGNSQSLVQSLLGAGVRNVIASRWSVDSEATRVLMDSLYDRLASGQDPSKALEGAGSQISSKGEWAHPYYWAGFDVFGQER